MPPASSVGAQAVQIAMGELGVPYVWGGASPAGFDCSGLTMWVYAQLGIHLDHFTGSQWNAGPHVARDQLAPGDLVFFEPGIGHVGIYIGNNEFIEAPHTGAFVQISSLSEPVVRGRVPGRRPRHRLSPDAPRARRLGVFTRATRGYDLDAVIATTSVCPPVGGVV